MPEQTITIGNRSYEVACQEGEEHYLQSAAQLLDAEAQVLLSQIGRLPETRMLLMAGLMLSDKTAGMEERQRQLESENRRLSQELDRLRNAPKPEPERVEVPVIPAPVLETLAELAARAEAIAETVEEKKAG